MDKIKAAEEVQAINGTLLLTELLKRADEENDNGQPVIRDIEDNIEGMTKYVRYDAMVFELNKLLKTAALSTQSPKWVKAKDRLPGDEVESLKEMPLRDAITKVPYHKVDILGFDNKTMYYRGINDEIHVKIKNIEWRESSTQPLQEKIDGLREDVKRIYDLHKVKLNGLKRNRMFPDENKLTDSECCAIDDQIQLLASILGDLNREILNKQP